LYYKYNFGANWFMSWLERLARELSARQKMAVTAADLIQQMSDFVASCGDPILRRSYPRDIHHFDRTENPQPKTVDLVLSFMDDKYHDLTPPIIKQLVNRLSKAAGKQAGEVDKILRKERFRRSVRRKSARDKSECFWSLNHRRVVEKYAGLYALIRLASDQKLRVELFSIIPRVSDPTTVTVFWQCRDKLRVGDLLVNSYRFSGLTVNKSTDKVVEPASLAFLRAPRSLGEPDVEQKKPRLVMGGFVVGWKDNDPHHLFHSRFALVKLDAPGVKVTTEREFSRVLDQRSVSDQLKSLARPNVTQTLIENFLNKHDLSLGHLDARNALPALFPENARKKRGR
jgi:hypothetical protein